MHSSINSFKSVSIIDLDNDGESEIVSYANGSLGALKYDALIDSLIFETYTSDDFISSHLLEYNVGDEPYLISFSGRRIRAFRFENKHFHLAYTILGEEINVKDIAWDHIIDLDGDGFQDIVDFKGSQDGYQILRYLGAEQFDELRRVSFSNNYGEFRDYDDDGDMDYLLEVSWYENVGDLQFSDEKLRPEDPPLYPDPNIFGTVIQLEDDLDLDGDIDIVTYNYFGEPTKVFENVNNQYFDDGFEVATTLHISGDLTEIKAVDADADGDKDIIMAAKSGLIWIECIGHLEYAEPEILQSGIQKPKTADVTDMNFDGFPDILLSTYDNPAGSFNGMTDLFLGSLQGPKFFKRIGSGDGTFKSAFANIDEQGFLDMVVVHNNNMFWAKLNEDSTIIYTQIDSDFGINRQLEIYDLDADGDDDLVTYCTTCFAPIPEQDHVYSFFINYTNDTLPLNVDTMSRVCPPSDVHLFNSENLSYFKKQYPDCEVINGDLYIGSLAGSEELRDISALEKIREVKGNLTLNTVNRVDLSGLRSLQEVEGDFYMSSFEGSHLGGLQNLKSVGRDFHLYRIYDRDRTGNLDSLLSLETIGGSLKLEFAALNKLTFPSFIPDSIHGDLILHTWDAIGVEEFLSSCVYIEHDFEMIGSRTLKSLNRLNSSFTVGNKWRMSSNKDLNYCNVDPFCRHIQAGKPYGLSNNGVTCSDLFQISCANSGLSGRIFVDENNNGIFDVNEQGVSNIEVIIENKDAVAVSNSFGIYEFNFQVGEEIEITLDIPEGWIYTTDSTIRIDSFVPGAVLNNNNDFGIAPSNDRNGNNSWLTVLKDPCANAFNASIKFENNCLMIKSGRLSLHYPPEIEMHEDYTDFTNHDDQLRIIDWDFEDVAFLENVKFNPIFESIYQLSDDDRLVFRLVTSIYENNIIEPLEELTWQEIVNCSSSQHVNKDVYPKDSLSFSQIDSVQPLYYTINFQNKTDDTVEHVFVKDNLNFRLDENTVQIVNSSHSVDILRDGQQLSFRFSDINLPSWTQDVVRSQGFVVFSVLPDNDIPVGIRINNTATVVFNSLNSENTNTVTTLFDEFSSTASVGFDRKEGMTLFPIPASDYFSILINGDSIAYRVFDLKITDIDGKLIFKDRIKDNAKVNTSNLESGIYFVNISDRASGFYAVEKLVIIN